MTGTATGLAGWPTTPCSLRTHPPPTHPLPQELLDGARATINTIAADWTREEQVRLLLWSDACVVDAWSMEWTVDPGASVCLAVCLTVPDAWAAVLLWRAPFHRFPCTAHYDAAGFSMPGALAWLLTCLLLTPHPTRARRLPALRRRLRRLAGEAVWSG